MITGNKIDCSISIFSSGPTPTSFVLPPRSRTEPVLEQGRGHNKVFDHNYSLGVKIR